VTDPLTADLHILSPLLDPDLLHALEHGGNALDPLPLTGSDTGNSAIPKPSGGFPLA